MLFKNCFPVLFEYLVQNLVTNKVWTRFTTIQLSKRYPYRNHHQILITKNYSQYMVHHLKGYGVHQTVTTNINRQ